MTVIHASSERRSGRISFLGRVAAHARANYRGPFRRRPRKRPAGYSESHLTKGKSYHAFFRDRPGRRLMWELEQSVLLQILEEVGPVSRHLDFAGGTGRIAGFMQSRCETQYILDISSAMLDVAREHLEHAHVVCRDFREGVPEVPPQSVDMVTAFRFFPNADEELRDAAMEFIASRLRPGGYLVCNNHRNFWSVPYVTARLLFVGGADGMEHREMRDLAECHGLQLIGSHSIGLIPQTDNHAMLPWGLVRMIEKACLAHIGRRTRAGYNVVYLFKKA
jgi:SAM-dependent methyltransferase